MRAAIAAAGFLVLAGCAAGPIDPTAGLGAANADPALAPERLDDLLATIGFGPDASDYETLGEADTLALCSAAWASAIVLDQNARGLNDRFYNDFRSWAQVYQDRAVVIYESQGMTRLDRAARLNGVGLAYINAAFPEQFSPGRQLGMNAQVRADCGAVSPLQE